MDISEIERIFAVEKWDEEILMDFEIKEIESLTGARAHVYSVILDGDEHTLLERFFDENKSHLADLRKVRNKILVMSKDTGCKKSFFKEGEGALGDGMVALRNTGCLRLYGVYFHEALILLGSGGYKPPGIKAYQDYPPLNVKAQQMRKIAQEIYRRITSRELIVHEDGTLEEF